MVLVVDRDVLGAIAGELVDLVDDAVGDFVGLDVVDHLHQRGVVGLPCGFPGIDELFGGIVAPSASALR